MDIVLVEDNDADAELIVRALRKCHIDNAIVRILDGQEALAVLLPATPHRNPGGPIVMLTGSTDERDRTDSDALGVNKYLVKPVATDAIAHMVSYAEMYWDLNC